MGENKFVTVATKTPVGQAIPSMCMFWIVTPCSLVGGNKCNRGANNRHLQSTIFVHKIVIQWGGDIYSYGPTRLHGVVSRKTLTFSATKYHVACWRSLVQCLALKKCHLTRKDRNFQKQKAGTTGNIYVGLSGGGGELNTNFFLARHAMKRGKLSDLLKLQGMDNSQQKFYVQI